MRDQVPQETGQTFLKVNGVEYKKEQLTNEQLAFVSKLRFIREKIREHESYIQVLLTAERCTEELLERSLS